MGEKKFKATVQEQRGGTMLIGKASGGLHDETL
jgi:hypothetical protein